jgi:hypothetical protein
MKTENNSLGFPGNLKNSLKGLGQKLKLQVIIPVIYAIVLITLFIIKHL